MTARAVAPGKQKCGVLCYSRTRILRVEISEGRSLGLLPYRAEPDCYYPRGTVMSSELIAQLAKTFVVCSNAGGIIDYKDANGGSYFAVVLAQVDAPAKVRK